MLKHAPSALPYNMSQQSGSFARRFFKRSNTNTEENSTPASPSGDHGFDLGAPSSEAHGSHLGTASGTETPATSPMALRARQHALTIMAKHTFEEAQKVKLICDLADEESGRLMLQGVALRVAKRDYAVFPRDRPEMMPWITGLCFLNVGVSCLLLGLAGTNKS